MPTKPFSIGGASTGDNDAMSKEKGVKSQEQHQEEEGQQQQQQKCCATSSNGNLSIGMDQEETRKQQQEQKQKHQALHKGLIESSPLLSSIPHKFKADVIIKHPPPSSITCNDFNSNTDTKDNPHKNKPTHFSIKSAEGGQELIRHASSVMAQPPLSSSHQDQHRHHEQTVDGIENINVDLSISIKKCDKKKERKDSEVSALTQPPVNDNEHNVEVKDEVGVEFNDESKRRRTRNDSEISSITAPQQHLSQEQQQQQLQLKSPKTNSERKNSEVSALTQPPTTADIGTGVDTSAIGDIISGHDERKFDNHQQNDSKSKKEIEITVDSKPNKLEEEEQRQQHHKKHHEVRGDIVINHTSKKEVDTSGISISIKNPMDEKPSHQQQQQYDHHCENNRTMRKDSDISTLSLPAVNTNTPANHTENSSSSNYMVSISKNNNNNNNKNNINTRANYGNHNGDNSGDNTKRKGLDVTSHSIKSLSTSSIQLHESSSFQQLVDDHHISSTNDNGRHDILETLQSLRKGSDASSSNISTTGCKISSLLLHGSGGSQNNGSGIRKNSDDTFSQIKFDLFNSSIGGSTGGEERERKESEGSIGLGLLLADNISIRKESDVSGGSGPGGSGPGGSAGASNITSLKVATAMMAPSTNVAIGTKKGIDYTIRYRKDSDASAASTLMSIRKESDASALSALIQADEEEMMKREAASASIHSVGSNNSAGASLQNGSSAVAVDPFENLRKLSDASSTVVSLEQLHQSPHKPEDLKDVPGGAVGLNSTGFIGLGEMKIKLDPSRDDASVATFENPADIRLLPRPEGRSSHGGSVGSKKGSNSCSQLKTSALDHLEALGPGKQASEDDGNSTVTMNDANQKMLVDALLMTGHSSRRNRAESWGGMSDISHNAAAYLASTASVFDANMTRGPSPPAGLEGIMSPRSQGSLNSFAQDIIPGKIAVPKRSSRERLDSLSSGSQVGKDRDRYFHRGRRDSNDKKPVPNERLESGFRERFDSFDIKSQLLTRDRLDSLANLSGIFSKGRDRLDSLASLGEVSLTMSVGDLEDVAGKLEQIVNATADDSSAMGSETSTAPKPRANLHTKQHPRNNLPAPTIQVDSEAVQAAVQAAMAATEGGVLDFLNIKAPSKAAKIAPKPSIPVHHQTPSKKPIIPHHVQSSTFSTPIITSAAHNDDQMEAIRARARAAAGYVHPDKGGPLAPQSKQKQFKKRSPVNSNLPTAKRQKLPVSYGTPNMDRYTPSSKAPSGALIYSNFNSVTPKRQNFGSATKSIHSTPGSISKGGQSNQKWDEMFECLVVYVKEERDKATKGMSEEEKSKWEWSGNVPTMYKTKDSKALGRWINNQRSAKSKGTLKRDREVKLVSTGLKWSVLTTNAWTDMMKELKIYVKDKTKDGKVWDGNVPTNYKIKNSKDSSSEDDKNLGRWINRQRSLYQAGRLKEERRIELEKIGLKWAVLSTTSWHSMYEALCNYAEARKAIDKNNHWDGHVPGNFETSDKPPKRLGRWVTRQRAQYSSKKLKSEQIEKLEKIGLSWEPYDTKAMSSPYIPLQKQKALPVAVAKHPRPKPLVPVVRQVKAIPTPSSKLPAPPVASLKPAVPSVSSLKSPTLAKSQPSSVVNNK